MGEMQQRLEHGRFENGPATSLQRDPQWVAPDHNSESSSDKRLTWSTSIIDAAMPMSTLQHARSRHDNTQHLSEPNNTDAFEAHLSSSLPRRSGEGIVTQSQRSESHGLSDPADGILDDPLLELATMAPLSKMVTDTEAFRNQDTRPWPSGITDDSPQGQASRWEGVQQGRDAPQRSAQPSPATMKDMITERKSHELFQR
jgi:hypothetical protein